MRPNQLQANAPKERLRLLMGGRVVRLLPQSLMLNPICADHLSCPCILLVVQRYRLGFATCYPQGVQAMQGLFCGWNGDGVHHPA